MKNGIHVRDSCIRAFTRFQRDPMIESTKPITETEDEPEILARYVKALPKGWSSKGHTLKADMEIEVEQTAEGWGATVEVECLVEYGWGGTEEEAINDLVSSLGDYKLWLMERKDNLADLLVS